MKQTTPRPLRDVVPGGPSPGWLSSQSPLASPHVHAPATPTRGPGEARSAASSRGGRLAHAGSETPTAHPPYGLADRWRPADSPKSWASSAGRIDATLKEIRDNWRTVGARAMRGARQGLAASREIGFATARHPAFEGQHPELPRGDASRLTICSSRLGPGSSGRTHSPNSGCTPSSTTRAWSRCGGARPRIA